MNTETRDKDFMKAFNRCDFSYKKEKNPLVKPNPETFALERIMHQFEESKELQIDFYSSFYGYHMDELAKIEYTKEVIQLFCDGYTENNDNGLVGEYISALVNKIIKEDETITINLSIPIDCIGYKHSKGTLVIYGNAGHFLGNHMSGGKISVEGNIKSISNFNYGGEIWERGKRVYPR